MPHCGIKTALQIASTGIGRDLINAARELSMPQLIEFSLNWANHFKDELAHNTNGILLRRYLRLAAAIPSDFPDISVLNLYVKPLTTASDPSALSFTWLAPDLGRLATFAEDNFIWGHVAGILDHFTDTVFSGLALRELIGATLQMDHRPNPFSSLIPLIDTTKPIISERRSSSTGHMAELRVSLPIPQIVFDLIKKSLRGKYQTPSRDAEADTWMMKKGPRVRVWMPLIIMQTVYSELVTAFTGNITIAPGMSLVEPRGALLK